MDPQHEDYVEPAPSAYCPAWVRFVAAVVLMLVLVETDLATRAWLDTISPGSAADEPLQTNW
jgi:hypothetical protein